MRLPGDIGVSHLRVYEGGGTPHLHTKCTEAYLVVGGTGSVQTLTLQGGFEETPLAPGALVSFGPGTVHRLMNPNDDLEIYVLMSDAGLSEAGDMVLTLTPELLTEHATHLALPDPPTLDAALHRRTLALEGFAALRDGGADALRRFHDEATRIVTPLLPPRRPPVEPVMADARVESVGTVPRFGCCGMLGKYVG
jgi:mannose-6-phosphate isomerase-like protein (cupin superfamily)